MDMAETPSPFFLMPSQMPPGLAVDNGFWPDYDGPQLKRQRSSDDDVQVLTDPNRSFWQHNGPGILSSAPPPPPPSLQNSSQQALKGSKIFFKTRLCMKFKTGTCPYGPNCSFAHGPEELRRPPPNWHSLAGLDDDRFAAMDRQRGNRLRICRKFYSGEECPYGERCTFAHIEPGSMRESSAISVGLTDSAAGPSQESEAGDGSVHRPSLWKPKQPLKWDSAELRKYGGSSEADGGALAVPLRGFGSPSDSGGASIRPREFLRLRGLRKITNIYADWIDD